MVTTQTNKNIQTLTATWRVRKRCTDNGYNTDKQKHTDTDCNMERERHADVKLMQHRAPVTQIPT